MKLASTTVAVTGGGGGLGSAICRAARALAAAELIASLTQDDREFKEYPLLTLG
jgi:NAD(P)-dependent dehydrogenase (short-subunit alcohol dehydrogenase family)